MKKNFIALLCFAAGWPWFIATTIAQPSVYSGAFAFGSGGLDTLARQQTITNFVNDAQKDVSIINLFKSWSTAGTNANSPFPTTAMDYIRSHGSIPLLSWEPWDPAAGITQPAFSLASITNGDHDAYITTWATAAKNWGNPFFLRLAHEMNGNWYPWSADVNGNTNNQYAQMWRHVHDIFMSVGATNVTWVWCVNFVDGFPAVSQFYPGDNYVDWLSLDGYCRKPSTLEYSMLTPNTMTQLTSLAPGKPIMVAETGCNQNVPDKAQWFRNALTNYLPAVQPRIKAWVYFNSTNTSDGNDWRITVPASAASGYQQGIGLPYYATNQYGAISSSPIQPLLNDSQATDTMPPFVSIVRPLTGLVTNGTLITLAALASDKSGVAKVVFSVNGVAQQTNNAPPYQFLWSVPFQGVVNYTVTATAFDNVGNSTTSSIQFVSQGAIVTNILQTVSQLNANQPVSPGDWTVAIWGGPPATAATSGNRYETPGVFFVRTPNTTTPAAFAGDSLQIDSGGGLYLKNGGQTSGNAASVKLVLSGGTVTFHGGFGVNGAALAGTLQVLSNSVINTDQTGSNSGDIWVQSPISGNGNLTVNLNSTTNAVILSGNNAAFTGTWTNASTFGSIKIAGGSTNALGSGGVRLVNPGASLFFNSTNDLTVANFISGLGSVVKTNINTVTLNGSNSFSGPLQITKGGLQLGADAAISGTSLIQLSDGAFLNVAAVPGGLVVGGAQTLAGSGGVAGNVTVNGTVNPGPLGTLNFSNSLILAGVTIMELNRTNVQTADLIAASTLTLGGTLTVTNRGPALQAGDAFQLFSGAISGAFAVTNLPPLAATNLIWDASKLNTLGILAVAAKPAGPPAILPPVWNGTNLILKTTSQAGFNYVLQATPQLAPANWTAVQTNAGGGLLIYSILINAGTQQFFRISVQ